MLILLAAGGEFRREFRREFREVVQNADDLLLDRQRREGDANCAKISTRQLWDVAMNQGANIHSLKIVEKKSEQNAILFFDYMSVIIDPYFSCCPSDDRRSGWCNNTAIFSD